MPPAWGTAMLMPSTSSRPSVFARLPASDSSVPWALNVQELQGPVLDVLLSAEQRRHEHEERVVAAGRRDGLDRPRWSAPSAAGRSAGPRPATRPSP